MLRKLFIILLLSSIIGAEEYTVADIQNAYSQIFTVVVYDNEEYEDIDPDINPDINKLDKKHFLADLINDNPAYFLFLMVNMHHSRFDSLDLFLEDTSGVGEHFKRAICRDTLFDKMLLTIVDNYLRSRGDKIADFKGIKKSKLDMDEVLAKAVRFFYPVKDEKHEKIFYKFCIFDHGQRELKDDRNYPVEAFCYAAIRRNRNNWLGRMVDIGENAREICYIEDFDTRYSRTLGAVWMHMYYDPELREALEKEYKRTRDFLPFKIKGL